MEDSIFHCEDYRDFLRRRFRARREKNSALTVGVLAREIGCSESFVKKIFARKVHLGYRFVERISTCLELTTQEETILFLNVAFQASANKKVRDLIGQILTGFKSRLATYDGGQDLVTADVITLRSVGEAGTRVV